MPNGSYCVSTGSPPPRATTMDDRPAHAFDTDTYVAATSSESRRLELDPRPAEVLAIGSQLTYGRVGLNATLPVLSGAGLRHAAIPTTILSVLPHYPSVHRMNVSPQWLAEVLGDLQVSGAIDQLRAVSIGYLAAPAHARVLADWKQNGPRTLRSTPLVLDPTLGDIGLGFYNDPSVAGALRRSLVPHATGLTPNLFELAQLTGNTPSQLRLIDDIVRAASSLLSETTRWIVVTGLRGAAIDDPTNRDLIGELVLSSAGTHLLTHPLLPGAPAGVGDTFTAYLVAQLLDGDDLIGAVESAAASTANHICQKGLQ